MDLAYTATVIADWVGRGWAYVGPIVGFWIAGRFAAGRDARNDRRQRHDAKLARLRQAFQPVLLSAWGMQSMANEMIFGYANETAEQKRQRINTMLAEAMKGINEARAQLAMEIDAQPVNDKFHEIRVAFTEYRLIIEDIEKGVAVPPDTKPTEKKKKVEDGVNELEKMIRDKITEVEKAR